MAEPINDIKTLINVLKSSFLHSTSSINYGDVLTNIASRNSVREIISSIVSVKNGIRLSPYYLYNCDSLLVGYMNECIAKYFENLENPTIKSFTEAYVNIRKNENQKTISERLVNAAIRNGLDVKVEEKSIQWTLTKFEHDYGNLEKYKYGTNGYKKFLPICKSEAAELLNKGYHPSDTLDGRRIRNVFSEVRMDQEKKRREEENIKKELKRRKEERRSSMISITIGIIGVVVFIALFIWLLSFCEGDDGTVGNWIIAIVCLLAWLKGGKK